MYAKLRECYEPNTRGIPQQALKNFHASQSGGHRCRTQETMTFSSSASAKTDDSLVFYNYDFYKISDVSDPEITMQKLKTSEIADDDMPLPWGKAGVKLYNGNWEDQSITVNKQDIQAKAILCGNVISSVYPQWVIT